MDGAQAMKLEAVVNKWDLRVRFPGAKGLQLSRRRWRAPKQLSLERW
jgi:hypothetical protein